ncbi:hypothetical protein IU501_32775 [Nocardia otitidiscaviarum]|uniref:hypothetical protein n=1 Tax=Nocardia otitidiscaviarum TaxID=1823 RepID=UPI0004A772EF|nr:hypothetical protein [Nocardia otitidiscaviarum]MBF6137746.1 hypothetical protein [Nocardia otitidiscaviarum]MBF6485267.1 hypothetical protein [Nocardia otitidiscaviarum]
MPSGHPEFFGEVVKARREHLSLTMAEVRLAGGPAQTTMVRTERGELDNPSKKIFSKFDTALRWTPGSAATAYWSGRPPTPVEPTSAASPLQMPGSEVAVPLDQIIALMGVQRDLNAAAEMGHGLSGDAVQDLATRLNGEVSLIVGRWATTMLERNRGTDTAHPGLEAIFADALSAPVDPGTPDAEERQYRRWLFGGRSAAGLGEELRQKFEQRYRQRGGDLDANQ